MREGPVSGFDSGFYFVVFGKVSLLKLGEDQLAIDAEFKPSFIGGNQLEFRDLFFEVDEDLFRQTDGFGFVASSRAVDEFDVHGLPPCGGVRGTSIEYRASFII